MSLAFVLFPLLPNEDVINSDWPAFATGARLIVSDPGRLYDLDVQQQVERDVTGGRVLVSPGIHGILPFLAPAWVALLAVPFELLGTEIGGRVWIIFGLACLGAGLYLATRPRPPAAVLPAFASVPTALLMLNAQLDGIVALGIGAALALRSRPYLAGVALGLTLVKPQLVLPLGVAAIAMRQWKVLAGWAATGALLLGATLLLNPRWVGDWLGQVRTTVAQVSREVDFAHFGTLLPPGAQSYAIVALVLVALAVVLFAAARIRDGYRAAAAILVIGGVVVAPHALPADLVLVAVGLAIWGEATWIEWVMLSVGAVIVALAPPPLPAVVGVLVIGGLLFRVSFSTRPARAAASPR